MKKKLLFSLAFVLTALAAAAQTTFTQGDFTYTVTDDVAKTVSVKQKDGTISGDLSIPSQVTEDAVTYTVTSVAENGFRYNTNITGVQFPASMRTIGADCFDGCTAITWVTLNDGLATIKEYAFWQCTALERADIPASVTSIEKGAFYRCTAMSTIIFIGSDEAGTLTLDNTTYTVFGECGQTPGSLTVELYRNITGITNSPFPNITTLYLDNHVSSLPEGLFDGCSKLSLVFGSTANLETMGAKCFKGTAITSPIIGAKMTEIPESAFYGCTNLTNATIPANITKLCATAFWYLNSEASVDVSIEDSTTPLEIYDSGNSGSDDMPFFNVSQVNTYVGRDIVRRAKDGNTSFATATLFNKKIVGLTIGPNVTTIGEGLFENSANLNNPTIAAGSSLTTIGNKAFYGCSSLTSFDFPAGVITIGENAFYGSGLAYDIVFPDGLTEIGNRAFEDCDALTSVTIPASVERIGHYAFTNCNVNDFTLTIADGDDPIEFVCNNNWPQFCDFPNLTVYMGRNITVSGEGGITTPFHTNVKSIEFGPKVTAIPNVKNIGSKLTTVKVHQVTPITIADDAFNGISNFGDVLFLVPGGTKAAYAAADGWKHFTEVQTWSFVLNFTVNGHGTMDIDGVVAANGETKTVRKPNGDGLAPSNWTWTVTPDAGYELTSLTEEDKTEATDPAVQEIFVGNAGWENPHTEGTAINHDLDYVATFAPITYTLSYTLNGGTATNPTTYNVETETFTLTNPTRTGYNFAGWKLNGEGDAMMTVTIAKGSTGNKAYTATWTPIVYNIVYTLDGGTATNPTTYTIETETFTLTNPTKTGYTFKGWKVGGEGDALMTVTIAKGSTGDKAYTATWQINQYTLTFNSNGGSEVAAITQNYGTTITPPANPTRTGYTFNGWDPEIPATMPAENMTLTAQWTINQYTITFDTNGGSAIAPITQDFGTAIEAPADPTRDGYTFAGWDVKIPTTMPATNMTITASWTPVTYTISYDLAGGSVATPNPTSYNIETASFTLNNPTKDHYDFAGWTGTGLGGATKTVTIAVGSTGNRSYTATWTEKTYSVVITGAGVTASNYSPRYGESVVITIAEDPDRTLTSLTVNGSDVTASVVDNKYTIASVSSDINVVATFASTKEFITLTSAEEATFSCPKDLNFSGAEVMAYIATGYNRETGTVLLTRVYDVPAGTGVYLRGEAGTYKIPYSESQSYYVNMLKAHLTAGTVEQTEGAYTNFVLANGTDGIGFYKVKAEGSNVAAQKAYLQVPSDFVAGAGGKLGFVFEDEVTDLGGFEMLTTAPQRTYNLKGQQVEVKGNGVYIVNGKKVAIKKN